MIIKINEEIIDTNVEAGLIRLCQEYTALSSLFIDTRLKIRENRKQIDKLEEEIAEYKIWRKTFENKRI